MTTLETALALSQPKAARVMQLLNALVAAACTASAVDDMQPPRALAFPMSARARRHLRTARVSWW